MKLLTKEQADLAVKLFQPGWVGHPFAGKMLRSSAYRVAEMERIEVEGPDYPAIVPALDPDLYPNDVAGIKLLVDWHVFKVVGPEHVGGGRCAAFKCGNEIVEGSRFIALGSQVAAICDYCATQPGGPMWRDPVTNMPGAFKPEEGTNEST